MKTIPLGSSGLAALVDDEDFERVSARKWYAHETSDGRGFYAVAWERVDGNPRKHRRVKLHRFVLGGSEEIDHINRNTLDNRRVNLRFATRSQNSANRAANRGRKFKGVHPQGKKFRALVMKDGISHNLGLFETAEEAARAYDYGARLLHGEFACVNFPEVAA